MFDFQGSITNDKKLTGISDDLFSDAVDQPGDGTIYPKFTDNALTSRNVLAITVHTVTEVYDFA